MEHGDQFGMWYRKVIVSQRRHCMEKGFQLILDFEEVLDTEHHVGQNVSDVKFPNRSAMQFSNQKTDSVPSVLVS